MPYVRKVVPYARRRAPTRYGRLYASSGTTKKRTFYKPAIKKRSPLNQRARRYVTPKIPFYRR